MLLVEGMIFLRIWGNDLRVPDVEVVIPLGPEFTMDPTDIGCEEFAKDPVRIRGVI